MLRRIALLASATLLAVMPAVAAAWDPNTMTKSDTDPGTGATFSEGQTMFTDVNGQAITQVRAGEEFYVTAYYRDPQFTAAGGGDVARMWVGLFHESGEWIYLYLDKTADGPPATFDVRAWTPYPSAGNPQSFGTVTMRTDATSQDPPTVINRDVKLSGIVDAIEIRDVIAGPQSDGDSAITWEFRWDPNRHAGFRPGELRLSSSIEDADAYDGWDFHGTVQLVP